MRINVKLEGELRTEAELFRHQGALLAASMICNTYNVFKEYLIGTGPELYAEQWMYNYLRPSDNNFDDLVMIYFVKILQAIQK